MKWPQVTRGQGEIIRETPSNVTCRYTLGNGQTLNVFFKRFRNRGEVGPGIVHVWTVSIYIGHPKAAKRWNSSRGKNNPATGKCGLEGLAAACRYIVAFARYKIGPRAALQVAWADERRRRAYRYMLRFDGFKMQKSEDGGEVCIEYRNPTYWDWNDKGEEQVNG